MNAKEEFLEVTAGHDVYYARLIRAYEWKAGKVPYDVHDLPENYTAIQYQDFLNAIDFKYYEGYGNQYLYGTICCENGIFFIRHEYDGSEYWEKMQYPTALELFNSTQYF